MTKLSLVPKVCYMCMGGGGSAPPMPEYKPPPPPPPPPPPTPTPTFQAATQEAATSKTKAGVRTGKAKLQIPLAPNAATGLGIPTN